jgi:hypothetical protein
MDFYGNSFTEACQTQQMAGGSSVFFEALTPYANSVSIHNIFANLSGEVNPW